MKKDRESNEEGSTADREETAEEKRVRIAKEYLWTMQKLEDSDSADDSSENDTKLAGRLKKNRLQTMGKYYRSIADKMQIVIELGD